MSKRRPRPDAIGKARRAGAPRPVGKRALEKTAAVARRRYGRLPNVVGVGVGTKLVGGRPTDVHHSVQFFVQRKTKSRARTRTPLPRFVWAQESRGRRGGRRKLVTDVIEVGRVELACRAGAEVGTTGRSGVATLVFRNKVESDPAFYLVTCAHVVGSIGNPDTDEDVSSECCAGGGDGVFARTVAMTGIEAGRVRYDIAIARVTAGCVPQPDCEVNGEPGIAMRRFVEGSTIQAGMTVRVALRGDLNLTGGVLSVGTVDVAGIPMENLRLTNIAVRFGDSGSLVFRDDAAIGILVARSAADGFGWFQPLGDALAHVCRKSDIEIKCFDD